MVENEVLFQILHLSQIAEVHICPRLTWIFLIVLLYFSVIAMWFLWTKYLFCLNEFAFTYPQTCMLFNVNMTAQSWMLHILIKQNKNLTEICLSCNLFCQDSFDKNMYYATVKFSHSCVYTERVFNHTAFFFSFTRQGFQLYALGLGQYSILLNIAIFGIICDIFHNIKYQSAVMAISGF